MPPKTFQQFCSRDEYDTGVSACQAGREKASMAMTLQITEQFSVTLFLNIQDATFAKHYGYGVRWSLFGERECSGLLDDSYLVQNFMQNVIAGWFDGHHEQLVFQSIGFCPGMIHGGILLPDGTRRPEITTPVHIQNQDFARGYRIERDWFFNEAEPHERMKTDRDFIERLQAFVDDQRTLKPEYFQTGETDLTFWYMGCLLGELSGYIFPQKEEEMDYQTIIIVTTPNTVVA
jgi:hypothetical protein